MGIWGPEKALKSASFDDKLAVCKGRPRMSQIDPLNPRYSSSLGAKRGGAGRTDAGRTPDGRRTDAGRTDGRTDGHFCQASPYQKSSARQILTTLTRILNGRFSMGIWVCDRGDFGWGSLGMSSCPGGLVSKGGFLTLGLAWLTPLNLISLDVKIVQFNKIAQRLLEFPLEWNSGGK